MKRTILLSVVTAGFAAGAYGTVINATPGSLNAELNNNPPTDNIVEVTGRIDVRDMQALTDFRFETVDLSKATIVSYSAHDSDSHGQSFYREGVIPQYAFFKASFGKLLLPPGTIEIGAGAFANSTISEISIPSGVRSVGDHAFYGCTKLTSVSLPSSVISLGAYAFANSSALKSANLQNTRLTILSPNVFSGCSSLTTIYLPSTLRTIGSHAFDGTSVARLDVAQVTTFEDYALAGMESLREITFNQNATIGAGVLMDDTHLETIINTPKDLPNLFAANCTALDADTVVSGVTNIGDYALANTNATVLVLSPRLTSVGAGAVKNVAGLQRIDARALGESIPDADPTAFDGLNTPQIVLHVDDYTEKIWEEHPVWSMFKIYSDTMTDLGDAPVIVTGSKVTFADGLLRVEAPDTIDSIEVYTVGGSLLLRAQPAEPVFEEYVSTNDNVLIVRVKTPAGLETLKLLVY